MRILLADENFPLPSVKALRANGHDVYSVVELDASISDEVVIEKAISEKRILLTFDKDFGELVFKNGYRPPNGIIFFLWEHYQPEEPGKFLITIFEKENLSFDFKITVIDESSIRQRNY